MNFKDRGFTIGDLTILLIVIIFSFFIIDKIREPKNQKQITNLYQLVIQKRIGGFLDYQTNRSNNMKYICKEE